MARSYESTVTAMRIRALVLDFFLGASHLEAIRGYLEEVVPEYRATWFVGRSSAI